MRAMPNIVRQTYGFIILVSIFISSTAPIVHAQTGDDSLSKGSSELLETIRKEELSAAIASGTENSTRWISRPAQATAFPMPSCVFPAGLCGAVNRDGSIAVAPRFDWVDRPSEDRMLVRLKGLYGYVDAAGRTVAEPQYEFAGAYSRGLAEVSINGVSRLIDREGRQVLEPSFARAHAFTADAFWVNDGRRHYTGQAGMAELINFEQTTVTNDIDADGKWGLLARTGEWIRKPEFRSISVFDPNDNSLARVKSDSGWGVTRPDGSWLIEPKFEALGRLYNGLAAARLEGKFGFVDRTGMPIIPPNYEQVGSFTNDALSTARLGGAWGLIDRNGNWVVQPQYQLILHDPYSDNPIVWVRIGEKYGAIDRQGKLVVAPRFTQRGGICEDGWVVGFDNGKQRLVPARGCKSVYQMASSPAQTAKTRSYSRSTRNMA